MKRFIALVLSLVMVLSLCAPAWAEGGAATELPKADNGVINLTGDVALGDKTVTISTDTTINLNGCTITASGHMFDVQGVSLTINGGNGGNGGKLVAGGAAIISRGNGTTANKIVVDGVTIKSRHFGVYHNGSNYGADVTIRNSTITDTLENGKGVFLSGSNAWEPDQFNKLSITGSTIKGVSAVEVKNSNVIVDNSTLTATYDKTAGITYQNSGSNSLGYALALTHSGVKDVEETAKGSITVNSGSFTGAVGIQETGSGAVNFPAEVTGNTDGAKIVVKGGTFNADPAPYKANGYGVSTNDDGTYTVKKAHAITFNANGGTGEMEEVLILDGGQYQLPECKFTAPEGKEFAGWATSAVATEVLGATYNVTEDVTFYAVWKAVVVDVPVTDKENEKAPVKVEATVSGSTATIETVENLDKETFENVKTDSVTLDFSEVKGTGESAGTPVNTVEIPTNVVDDIKAVVSDPTNKVDNLEIVTADATVTFDAAAVEKIAKNAGTSSVSLTVEVQPVSTATDVSSANQEAFAEVMEKDGSENAVLLSIDLVGANETDKLFSEGKSAGTATVKVQLAEGMKSATLYYLNGDKVEELGSYNADAEGYITVTLKHFSEYVLLGSDKTIPTYNGYYPIVGGTTTTDKEVVSASTFDAGIALYVGMSIVAAAGSAVVIGKKKEF